MEWDEGSIKEYTKYSSIFLLPPFVYREEEVGAGFEVDDADFFRMQSESTDEVFFMFFGIDEDLISEVATDEVDDVPKPSIRMPTWHAFAIGYVRVVQRDEGIEDEFSP